MEADDVVRELDNKIGVLERRMDELLATNASQLQRLNDEILKSVHTRQEMLAVIKSTVKDVRGVPAEVMLQAPVLRTTIERLDYAIKKFK